MKNRKPILLSALLTMFAFSAVIYTSCHKDKCSGMQCYNGSTCSNGVCQCPSGYHGTHCELSTITFQNDTYTPITISVNGSTGSIPVNSSLDFIAAAGSTATVSAGTQGTFGLPYNWSFTDNFPTARALLTEPLDVDASMFYLEVTNYDATSAVTHLTVNYQIPHVETDETVSIPNDGNTYGVGYYLGYANTQVVYTFSDGFSTQTSNLIIPNVANASYNLAIHN